MSEDFYAPIDPSRPVYSGDELMVVRNFLASANCTELVEFAESEAGMKALVGDINEGSAGSATAGAGMKDGGVVGRRADAAFVAERVDLQSNKTIEELGNSICRHIYTRIVGPYYKVDIEWFEVPHLLRYTSGGNYIAHSDCENWSEEKQAWVRGVDRDFSSIIYLNSEFTGGSLVFPYLNLRLFPQPGMLVTFPSDHRFLHAAEETMSGKRFVMVTWAAARGAERVMKQATPFIVRLP